jgi:cellulose synthase/poly-beta-1,6-N-acetylglucosamine synthase-like glycosyltransferase
MAGQEGSALDVSVIVPTGSRPAGLANCLEALEKQETAEPFEIVVVADGDDEIGRTVEVVARFPRARLVHQPKRGPAAARNMGAASAHGSLLCFTDDDCRPARDWLHEMTQSLRAGALVVAGMTASRSTVNSFAVASDVLAVHFTGQSSVAFAPTNNVACRASVLHSVPFDERYERAAGEDREWCAQLARRGITLTRAPEAVVLHDLQASLRKFLAQQLRYGRGSYMYHRGAGRLRPLEPLPFYARLLLDAARRGPGAAVLVVFAQLAIAIGFASEAARLLGTGRR